MKVHRTFTGLKIALQQQTPEWHEFRKDKIGASDAAVIMELSPWKTPYQLWAERLGLADKPQMTSAMERGLELEEKARWSFAKDHDFWVSPTVVVHPDYPWMMASLDGLCANNEVMVEIKCAGRSDHAMAKTGMVPKHYIPQLQHQMAVSGLDVVYYYSFDGDEGITICMQRDEEFISRLIAKEEAFLKCLNSFESPELAERDFDQRTDMEWGIAAASWKSIKEQILDLEIREKEARDELIMLAGQRNVSGAGVKLARVQRKGSVDYQKVPQLEGVDLEPYRKKSSIFWKIAESESLY